MQDLGYLLFASQAMVGRGSAGELAIIRNSVSRNAERHITGCLHRESGRYLQYIEGRAADILALCASLAADPRHRGMVMLAAGALEVRQFPVWGFSAGTSRIFRSEPGYGPPIDPSEHSAEHLIQSLRALCLQAARDGPGRPGRDAARGVTPEVRDARGIPNPRCRSGQRGISPWIPST